MNTYAFRIADSAYAPAQIRQASNRTLKVNMCLSVSQASPKLAVKNDVMQHRASRAKLSSFNRLVRVYRRRINATIAGTGSRRKSILARRARKCSWKSLQSEKAVLIDPAA